MTFDAGLFLETGEGWVLEKPRLRVDVEKVIRGAMNFFSLPKDEKDRWTFDLSGRPERGLSPDPDDGYRFKDGDPQPEHGGRPSDKKEIFHWRPSLARLCEGRGIDLGPHEDWFYANARLHHAARESWLEIGQLLEEALSRRRLVVPRIVGRMLMADFTIRTVSYLIDGGEAQEHTDRGAFTFRYGSTHPGKYRARGVIVPPRPGLVHGFGGRRLARCLGIRSIALSHSADALLEHEKPSNGEVDHPKNRRTVVVGFPNLYVEDCPPMHFDR